MYEPPNRSIDYQDFIELTNRLQSKELLNMQQIFKYLSFRKDQIGDIDLGKTILIRAELYLGRIRPPNLPQFLDTYLNQIEEDNSKQVIFLAMYIAAKKHYTEMMVFQKFVREESVLKIFNRLRKLAN